MVGAVGLAYGASAAGRHFEKRLWPRWPHDTPTHRWLHPEDAHCSQQQRRRWFEAIGKVVHLDIAEAAASGDRCELELVINDAVRELRHRFRHTNEIGLLDTHNEDYGFARNLAGLRVFWLPVSAVSGGISWATYFFTGNGLALGVASIPSVGPSPVVVLYFARICSTTCRPICRELFRRSDVYGGIAEQRHKERKS